MKSKLTIFITLIIFLFLTSVRAQMQENKIINHVITVDGVDSIFTVKRDALKYRNKSIHANHNARVERRRKVYYLTTFIEEVQDTVYYFDSNTVVHGEVSDEVALNNKIVINNALEEAKSKGYKVFEISGKNNIYVEVGSDNFNRATDNCIQLQSNMHFKMSADTWIRVQPNDRVSYAVLGIRKGKNITITGGHLIGDRYNHDYVQNGEGNDGNTHEFGYGVYPRGVVNFKMENVHIADMTGDCIIGQSSSQRNNDGSEKEGEVYNKNWIITNNILDNARRNNISITDIDGAEISNNIISNGGSLADDYANGISPASGIDLESWVVPDGNYYLTEITQNIKIFGNTFEGNNKNDLIFQRCNNIEVWNNSFDNAVANVTSHDISIHDNIFNSRGHFDDNPRAIHIISKLENGIETNYNYAVYNNTVTGFRTGIFLAGLDIEAHDNIITECFEGIQLGDLTNANLYNNSITSEIKSSKGYRNYASGSTMINVTLTNENIEVDDYALIFDKLNKEASENQLTINNCKFVGYRDLELRDSHFITFNGCEYSVYNEKNGTSNIIIND